MQSLSKQILDWKEPPSIRPFGTRRPWRCGKIKTSFPSPALLTTWCFLIKLFWCDHYLFHIHYAESDSAIYCQDARQSALVCARLHPGMPWAASTSFCPQTLGPQDGTGCLTNYGTRNRKSKLKWSEELDFRLLVVSYHYQSQSQTLLLRVNGWLWNISEALFETYPLEAPWDAQMEFQKPGANNFACCSYAQPMGN